MNQSLHTVVEYYKKGVAKLKRIAYKTEDPVYNVFHQQYTRNALLSYITSPFKLGISYRHNNTLSVQEIAKILGSLGYNVDVIDYKDQRSYSYEKYDLIIGFGEPFAASYPKNGHAIRVFYGTTMTPAKHNQFAIMQLQAFHKRHHVWWTESARIEEKMFSLQVQAVNAIVMYGNKLVQDSYQEIFSGPIYRLHDINFVFRPTETVTAVKKNWDLARKKFCMFPAAGMIHKGVDIVLDLFSKHLEWELYLGAPITREPRFMAIYQNILSLPNIHFQGFVDMSTPAYWNILDECGFFLSPSAAEGCPTSVVNACTNGKVIPIATSRSGLEPSSYNIPIREITEESLEQAIKTAQTFSNKELETKSLDAHHYYYTAHSKEAYQKELIGALTKILAASKV